MSDICAKNLGHGHAFNRPFGSTYKCQWCGELQSDIAEAGVVAHDSECAMMDSNENFCTCGAHDSVSSWSPTPSAQAIETAAIIRCAEVAYGTIRANLGFSVEAEATKQSILALIPQDGRTQLEEFGMKVATETRSAVLINTREDLFTEDSSLRAIVTNLIGADLPEADKEKS